MRPLYLCHCLSAGFPLTRTHRLMLMNTEATNWVGKNAVCWNWQPQALRRGASQARTSDRPTGWRQNYPGVSKKALQKRRVNPYWQYLRGKQAQVTPGTPRSPWRGHPSHGHNRPGKFYSADSNQKHWFTILLNREGRKTFLQSVVGKGVVTIFQRELGVLTLLLYKCWQRVPVAPHINREPLLRHHAGPLNANKWRECNTCSGMTGLRKVTEQFINL